MKIAATGMWIGLLALLPGCSLLWGGNHPDVEPEYFAVSRGVEPLWPGSQKDSISHQGLRQWLLDSGMGGWLSNTFDPNAKIVGTHGLLIQRDDRTVEAFVFEGALRITPAGQGFYGVIYDAREGAPALWSEAGGFEPLALPAIGMPWMLDSGVGGAVAVIPGQAVFVTTTGGLVALDWVGEPLPEPHFPDGFEIDAVFPVLGDTAILLAYPQRSSEPYMDEGIALWRPGEGLHAVDDAWKGSVHGPQNAYFGFHHDLDRVVHLSWPAGGDPTASRVLNVRGWGRTASSLSPDGRFMVSGDFGFKVLRNDPCIHQVDKNGKAIVRRVAELGPYEALDPVWLHPSFGAPTSVQIVPRP